MYIEKLLELNKSELSSSDDYKYVISTYEDVTQIEYFEKNEDKKYKSIWKFDFPSFCDIQICEKIIELRKAFKE